MDTQLKTMSENIYKEIVAELGNRVDNTHRNDKLFLYDKENQAVYINQSIKLTAKDPEQLKKSVSSYVLSILKNTDEKISFRTKGVIEYNKYLKCYEYCIKLALLTPNKKQHRQDTL